MSKQFDNKPAYSFNLISVFEISAVNVYRIFKISTLVSRKLKNSLILYPEGSKKLLIDDIIGFTTDSNIN